MSVFAGLIVERVNHGTGFTLDEPWSLHEDHDPRLNLDCEMIITSGFRWRFPGQICEKRRAFRLEHLRWDVAGLQLGALSRTSKRRRRGINGSHPLAGLHYTKST